MSIEVVVCGRTYVVKSDRRYGGDHVWAMVVGDRVRIGLSDYGQSELRDVIGVELPEVGREVKAGDVVAVVEGVKATSDVRSPLSGRVACVNTRLVDEPELINTDPYGDGWILELEGFDMSDYEKLLSPEQYVEILKTRS